MERERKRRQLKTQGGTEKTSFFQATKLALMNSGLIPLKKGESLKTYSIILGKVYLISVSKSTCMEQRLLRV